MGTSTEQNPVYTYPPVAKTYVATLTVTDSEGIVATSTADIVITPETRNEKYMLGNPYYILGWAM